MLFSHPDGSKQGADTDTGSSQIVDLIDFQRGIDLTGTGQDICHLIRCDGIQSASERIQLDQIQVFFCLDIVCSGIQSGVIHPLIHDIERSFYFVQMRDRIFCQDGNIIGVDQLRQSVIDLRVRVIRTSGKNNSAIAGFIQKLDRLFTFTTHIFSACSKFQPCFVNSSADLICGNRKFFTKLFNQSGRKRLFTLERHKRMHKINFSGYDRIHVIFDIFRIGSYDRTVVVVVGFFKFISFVRDTRIKNMFDPFVDKPLYMSVCQLCRITFGCQNG